MEMLLVRERHTNSGTEEKGEIGGARIQGEVPMTGGRGESVNK